MHKETVETYNRVAEEYDAETTCFWDAFPNNQILTQFSTLTHDPKVLDLGSGPGRDGLLLAQRNLEVICLDAAESMAKITQQKGLPTIRGDFMFLPFKSESFGGVWAYTSLIHVPKNEILSALAEIKRVLKSDGLLGLGVIEGGTESNKQFNEQISLPRYFSYYQKGELEQLLRVAGFSTVFFEQFKPRTRNYLHFLAKK